MVPPDVKNLLAMQSLRFSAEGDDRLVQSSKKEDKINHPGEGFIFRLAVVR
jgi:hypothetical protein